METIDSVPNVIERSIHPRRKSPRFSARPREVGALAAVWGSKFKAMAARSFDSCSHWSSWSGVEFEGISQGRERDQKSKWMGAGEIRSSNRCPLRFRPPIDRWH
ncbi:hypothetical protein Dimus_028581 [Dionaea muscipula]